jgi:hypothetical protein
LFYLKKTPTIFGAVCSKEARLILNPLHHPNGLCGKGFRRQASGIRHQAPGFRHQAPGFRHQVTVKKLCQQMDLMT